MFSALKTERGVYVRFQGDAWQSPGAAFQHTQWAPNHSPARGGAFQQRDQMDLSAQSFKQGDPSDHSAHWVTWPFISHGCSSKICQKSCPGFPAEITSARGTLTWMLNETRWQCLRTWRSACRSQGWPRVQRLQQRRRWRWFRQRRL